jgi:hypothetical protein
VNGRRLPATPVQLRGRAVQRSVLEGVSPNCHTGGKVAAGKAIEDSCGAESLTL